MKLGTAASKRDYVDNLIQYPTLFSIDHVVINRSDFIISLRLTRSSYSSCLQSDVTEL